MEYYKASHAGWRKPIERVEVERETESSVFIKDRSGVERRHAKKSGWDNYFDSFEGAKKWLFESALNDLERAREKVRQSEEILIKYESLEKEL